MIRAIVESMRRLYIKGKITREQLLERIGKGIISTEEYDYIVGN